jgi:hypothetical protein
MAVTATLKANGVVKFILVANIYIGAEGIIFRIDNGPWINAPVPLGAVTTAGITQIMGSAQVNNVPTGAVSLKYQGYALWSNIKWEYTIPEFSYSQGEQ